MGDNPDDYLIVPRTKVLKPDLYKPYEFLDIEPLDRFFLPGSARKTGFEVFDQLRRINPSNFESLSYLNLDGCCYTETTNPEKDKKRYRIPCRVIHERHVNFLFRSLLNAKIVKIKRRGYDLRHFLIYNISDYEFPKCCITMWFLSGSNYRMKLFLKNGFQRLPTTMLMEFLRSGQRNPMYRLYDVLDTIRYHDPVGFNQQLRLPPSDWPVYNLHRAFLFLEILFAVCKLPHWNENAANRHARYTDIQDNKWMRCCTLLWRSIPDPYFTVSEVRNILDSLMIVNPATREQDYANAITNLANKYRQKFPKVGVNQVPRSLMHLCRCFIRDYMSERYLLPDGIDKLDTTEILKSYLKLER